MYYRTKGRYDITSHSLTGWCATITICLGTHPLSALEEIYLDETSYMNKFK